MGTPSRHVVIGALATLGLINVAPTVHAQGSPASALGLHGSRIRTDSPVLRTLIRDASERSQTFRELVAAIDASDGIVYVRVGSCGRLRACLLHRVGFAGLYRVLTILVDPQRPDVALMGAIGHELRHAVEVLSDPAITSAAAVLAFYRRYGVRMRGVLETREAIDTGDAVRNELRRTTPISTSPIAESGENGGHSNDSASSLYAAHGWNLRHID